ncbi:MAG: hypothetical protein ACRDSH_11475, partial [Pseudonocardiaceae bacterium]
ADSMALKWVHSFIAFTPEVGESQLVQNSYCMVGCQRVGVLGRKCELRRLRNTLSGRAPIRQ